MKKAIVVTIVLVLTMLLLAACSNPGLKGDYSSGDHASEPSAAPSLTDAESDAPADKDVVEIPAGQLTAAEWSDNEHFDQWLALFESSQEGAAGVLAQYLNQWEFDTLSRVAVVVKKESAPVQGAAVKVYSGETLLYSAMTDAKGKAYLFPQGVKEGDELRIAAASGEATADTVVTYAKNLAEVEMNLTASVEKLNRLEIMFVVDTTGSMSDELEYLKVEVKDVVGKVRVNNPQADISVALLFYRDIGDEYVTRYFDFNSDIEVVKTNISAQSAGGGGDFPEAVHTALNEAVGKQWSTGNATRLIIHLLDAPPHHDKQEVMDVYTASIATAAQKGIRMIPVASSGVDKATEYLLRNEAMMTGGTYVFLTNESGIGGEHLAPTIEGYTVEYFNALLVRVISEYYTGTDIEPVAYTQAQG